MNNKTNYFIKFRKPYLYIAVSDHNEYNDNYFLDEKTLLKFLDDNKEFDYRGQKIIYLNRIYTDDDFNLIVPNNLPPSELFRIFQNSLVDGLQDMSISLFLHYTGDVMKNNDLDKLHK